MFTNTLVFLVAILHVWFMIFEMFMWTTPYALKAFKMTKEVAESSKKLAMNQGLYNGFLAAGLIWAMNANDPMQAHSLKLFFLGCVAVAGIYGALTANKRIFFIQGLPALIALVLVIS